MKMMNHITNRLLLAAVLILGGTLFPSYGQENTHEGDGVQNPNLSSRQEFREAGLGIFIHWGIYSMLGDGEWVLNDQDIDCKEYAKLAGGFYPEGFDAEQWVKAAKAAGAGYICFTSRHHDGFSMFGSEHTDYDIVDATPFGRDIVGELADACHKADIRLHLYYSLIDWSRELPLETCQTMGASWGYDIKDTEYKSSEELIHYLVNAAGRGGNLLLNIGPGPDGRLPVRALDRLRDIGEWMDEFGFTIYGSQRGDILPRDWGATTRKGDTLYVHILDLPDNSLFLPLTGQKVTGAVCVNDGKRIRFIQDKDGVVLKLGRIPEETDTIIGLTLK